MASPKIIVLIGYRGSGKSSVGSQLAKRLGWAWSDSDEAIEAGIDGTIAEHFAASGEASFRDLETAAIKSLISQANEHGQVISLGGGAPMFNDNPTLWLNVACCVYLRGTAATLYRRISSDESSEDRRPDLTDQGGLAEVQKMLNLRSATYEDCADFIVDVDAKAVDAIVDQIVELYSNQQNPPPQ